jgi:centrosomal protein CEP19
MSRIGSTKFGNFGDFGSTTSSMMGKGSLGPLNSKPKDVSNSKNTPKVEANDYVPKRFGLRYNPPTIIVEYLVPSSGKLYHHKIKIPHLKADSDTWDTLDIIKKKNSQYFGVNKIADNQITDFIERLKKKLPGGSTVGTFLTSDGFGENKKDSGMKLGKLTPSTSNKPTNNLSSFDTNKATPNSKNASAEKAKNNGGNNFWGFDDLEDLEEDDEEKVDYNNTNLNKLSKEELQKHKDKMSVLFNKNQKKPGDSGFVYDKQEEFVANEDNEWDEDF